jgi:long-chain acyl-CoA synthetase
MKKIPDTLYSSLLISASHDPERVALAYPGGSWSYRKLLTSVDRACDMFWQLGVRKGDKVALSMRNYPEFVVTNFALAKIGAVAVPLNFMVTKASELKYMLADANAKGIVTQNEFAKHFKKIKNEIPELKFILSIDDKSDSTIRNFRQTLESSKFRNQAHLQSIDPNDTAIILYTSGTTGNPKGVLLSHKNLLSNAVACQRTFNVTQNDVFLCLLPIFHTFAWTTSIILPLLKGCKTVIVPNITPARPWLHLMGKEGVTLMPGVPQIFSLLAKEAKLLQKYYLQFWAFRKLRCCISGAAPLNVDTVSKFKKAFGVDLLEGYGLSETSPVVSSNKPEHSRPGSVGKPIPGVKIKIIDERENVLEPDTEGEICVKGPNVTIGYHNNPTATKELFTADGWLKTGDIGKLDKDGFVYICDRKKDMIIIKGLKVFSAQVEKIVNEFEDVEECAVIGIKDREGNETIKCYCVSKPNAKLCKIALKNFLKTRLDAYKRPRDIEIVSELPKNTLKKTLKNSLRKKEEQKAHE